MSPTKHAAAPIPSLVSVLALALALFAPADASAFQVEPPTLEVERYEVGTAMPPLDEGRPLETMTLEEAIDRALEHNLNIRSARLQPEIQRYSLQAAHAAFNPTLNASLGHNSSTNQSTSQLDGGTRITNRQNSLNLSFIQPLPWQGAQFSASFNNSRTATDNVFATRNPSYRSAVSFNFTQPLLSGRRMDNQRNALRTQEIQRQITDVQLRTQVENLTAQVRVAYWGLRAQIEQIEIQRRNLAQAEQLLENNRVRVELGTMVESALAQAEAQVAAAEQALLNAEIQWRNQELALKQLLVGGTDDPLYRAVINPVDLPEYEPVEVDLEEALQVAMQNRPDLQQQRQQREISELNLEVTRENARPNLNLSASYSLQGVGGNLFERSGLGGEPQLVEAGGYFDGLSSIASFDTPSLNVSLNFSYPIGTSSQQANLEQARIQLRQSDLQLQAQRLQIETEVTNAGLAVTNTYLQLEAARRSREAAERSAEAEMTRFTVGVSTNFQVAAAQDQLTSARLSELQAIIGYINALEEFERVQGTNW
jgi:outer membrane protein TolC